MANVGCGEGGNEIRRSKSGHVARRNGIVHFSFPKSAPKEPFKTPFPPTHVTFSGSNYDSDCFQIFFGF